MTILLSRCRLGLAVLVGAASLAVTVDAANPHLVSADSTMSDPVLGPASLTWDTGLAVPFRIAGLGNNPGLDVRLNAQVDFSALVKATTTANSLVVNQGFTLPSGGTLTLTGTQTSPGSLSFSLTLHQVTPTITSNKNGNVSGTLVIPGVVNASIPDDLLCVRVAWTKITLTFNGQTAPLPDLSREFDSTGSVCP
jgi:hypothetical protein